MTESLVYFVIEKRCCWLSFQINSALAFFMQALSARNLRFLSFNGHERFAVGLTIINKNNKLFSYCAEI
ncbi:MAG: hypothetical protein KJ725_15085 [Gammaproteobacteria bacterium]|uniref:hypothetical protein n=1 Tax=Methylotuvimicrobium sp. TaxID=2822413 RepID=UPI001D3E9813|nr:hypothetical protein [Gammaproteobacteria bacterium]